MRVSTAAMLSTASLAQPLALVAPAMLATLSTMVSATPVQPLLIAPPALLLKLAPFATLGILLIMEIASYAQVSLTVMSALLMASVAHAQLGIP